ncbi:MAG: hypothetical protein WAN60_18985 [Candidatus Sulfotelmatobacter sp.]
MGKLASLVFAGACFSSAFGQAIFGTSRPGVELLTEPIPHPYFYLGPSSSAGGGFGSEAYRAEVGVDVETVHVVLDAMGAYEGVRKNDDNDQPNPNGRERYLESAAYYRVARGWSVGGGLRWNQLSTTNYSKSASRPEVGGEYDLIQRPCDGCRRDFSMRVNLDWVMAGTGGENGSQGAAITMTLPTPREKRHWFFRSSVIVDRFHTTITEPDNLALSREQRGQQHFAGFADSGLVYRF